MCVFLFIGIATTGAVTTMITAVIVTATPAIVTVTTTAEATTGLVPVPGRTHHVSTATSYCQCRVRLFKVHK